MGKKRPASKDASPQADGAKVPDDDKEQGKAASQKPEAKKPSDPQSPQRPEEAEGSTGDPHRHECVVVGVGASAGGLEAYKRLLQNLPSDAGVAYVLVQHLDPSHESLMGELLSKHTAMPVRQVGGPTSIRPNHIYIIPPNRFIKISDGGLFLDEPVTKRGVRLPIDYFFRSLAQARKERAICVVLSGTGSDGADGLRDVKAEGGMTLVQKPETADYDGMPRAAIHTGAVDFVLPIEEMADVIVPYAQHPYVLAKPEETFADTAPDHFRAILSLLKLHTNQDFSRYKTGTLTRRIDRRMGIRQIAEPADYVKLLREDDDELRKLFKDLLIGVTRFFRDPKAWEDLAGVLAREILEKRNEEPFRVWVPGCSTGEEAYSVAMLLFEQQKRHNRRLDIQVFATDIDNESIEIARHGLYPENVTKDLPENHLDAYFQREGEQLRVRKKLRETCIFAAQNMLADPPFSNLDMICCRNLLIYLEADVQRRVFDMLHFALKPGGLLFLGSSESPGTRKHLFEVLSQSSRIYRKVGESKPGSGGFPIDSAKPRLTTGHDQHVDYAMGRSAGTAELSRRALLEKFAPASVVVDQRGIIQYMHGSVGNYLDFPSGEPELDLAAMAQEGLRAKTRRILQRVRSSKEAVSMVASRVRRNGGYVAVRVQAHPLPTAKGVAPLYLVSFLDEAPPQGKERTDSGGDEQPLDAANEEATDRQNAQQLALELQATREDLQSTIEELESANEELKASNEEVMSMNEELQSTNEELETSREELQSLNEELSTVNNQLHDKVEELEATTNDLANLLASTDMATLFLDNDLRIRRYTPATSRLMNIIETDIGRPISDLSSRVNDSELVSDAREVLDRLVPVEKEVRNGGDRCFMRRVTPFRTSEKKIEGVVITFTDVTRLQDASRRVEFRERQQAVIAQLGRAALSGEKVETLCQRAAREIAETLDVGLSKILRLEPDRKRLRLVAGVGWENGLVGKATEPGGLDSPAGFTLQTSGPVIVRDLSKEKRFSGSELLERHGVVSGVSVLIGPEHAPWGTLGAYCREETEFTLDDSNFVVAVANVIWEAVRRKAIEAELRDSENRMAAFLNNSAVVGWMKDEQGRHTYLSANYQKLFDVKLEDWLGKTDEEVWPAEIAKKLRANDLRVLETNEPQEIVEEAVLPDGSQAYFLSLKFPFTDGEGNRFVGGLGVDITDRIRAEQERDRERALLEAVLEAMPAGVVIADAKGRITHDNAAARELWGISPETTSWKEYDEWVAWWPDTGERIKADQWAMTRALLHGEVTQGELIRNQRFGSEEKRYYLNNVAPLRDAEGRITGGVGAMLDVTDRVEAERALDETEEQMRLAAGMAGFGIYTSDLTTGKARWSPELQAIFGVAPDELVSVDMDDIPDFVHPDDRERLAEKIAASLNPSGDGKFRDEHRIIRSDGKVRWIFMQGRTQFEGEGPNRRAVRSAGVALDITHRHQAEEQLQEARLAAEAANQAKSAFLANMSHEIRTPMTAILGYADVLDARVNDPEAKACVHTIKANGNYLCEIINDILDLSKIESGKVAIHADRCSILEILAEVRSLMLVKANEKSLALTVEFDGVVPKQIETDSQRVRQVLVNLVSNAVKFTESGGVRIVTRCLREQEMLELEIIDTGMGIDQEDVRKLFTPFEQVDSSFTRTTGGSGLGLSISRKLVDMLGGQITIESTVGEGSTFRFTMKTGPLDQAEWIAPDPAALCNNTNAEPAFKRLPMVSGRILVVDDRPEVRYLVREFVESAGGRVEAAENGAEAVQAWIDARQAEESFDLILMDVQMPEMDGLEATKRIREEGYQGPIIALTANAMRGDRRQCREAGCDDFVAKPIDRAELVGKLASWLSRPDREASKGGNRSGKSVLFVDDHKAVREIHEILLKERGHQVVLAATGEEALEAVDSFTPDVAFIDLGLDQMSGAELLTQLKAKPALTDCVFICYSGRDQDDVAWRDMGFDYYLRKPIEPNEIDRLLRREKTSANQEAEGTQHVFDRKVALHTCFDSEQMLERMIEEFFTEAGREVAAIHKALEDEDLQALRKTAHRLKNTIVFLGAARAREALEALECADTLSEAPKAVERLETELKQLETALDAYRKDAQ